MSCTNRISILLLLVTLILSGCQPIAGTTPKITAAAPTRILFLGDYLTSANLGIGTHIANLAASANPTTSVEVSQVTMDEYGNLQRLWNETDALQRIRQGGLDVVVLEENLAKMTDQTVFKEYVRKFDQEIEKVGAETVLYMTWEYDLKLKELSIEEIAGVYGDIGTELGIKVAPAGLAWQRARQEHLIPDLYQSDHMMPSIYGTYLAACVLYATIFDRNPSGLAARPADLSTDAIPIVKDMVRHWPQITEDEAAFLQRVAWEIVREYQAQD